MSQCFESLAIPFTSQFIINYKNGNLDVNYIRLQ